MPIINVSLKDGANPDELEKAKQAVAEQGGHITHEYKLIQGFTAELPDDKVDIMQSNVHIVVEADQEVRTQ